MSEVKYPNISVQLIGVDSNAFSVLGVVAQALKRGGVDREEVLAFRKEAMSGDYDHLLATCAAWVSLG